MAGWRNAVSNSFFAMGTLVSAATILFTGTRHFLPPEQSNRLVVNDQVVYKLAT